MTTNTATVLFATLVAFAANSLLARFALRSGQLGPMEFTVVRLTAGALFLSPLLARHFRNLSFRSKEWDQPLALFSYALFFSLAYVNLGAATGALVLFASVQMSMFAFGLLRGARPRATDWGGLAVSFSGLVYLLLPGLTTPPLLETALMGISGFSWGIYSVLGRGTRDPVFSTARNFLFTLPLCLALWVGTGMSRWESRGIWLAVTSGAITSALGYVLWYRTLPRLSSSTAAVVQLSVPLLAAGGAFVFLGDPWTPRLTCAGAIILGGIALTLRPARPPGD